MQKESKQSKEKNVVLTTEEEIAQFERNDEYAGVFRDEDDVGKATEKKKTFCRGGVLLEFDNTNIGVGMIPASSIFKQSCSSCSGFAKQMWFLA